MMKSLQLLVCLLLSHLCVGTPLGNAKSNSFLSEIFPRAADVCTNVCDGSCKSECPIGELVGSTECTCKNNRGVCCITDPQIDDCSDCGGVCKRACGPNDVEGGAACECGNGKKCCISLEVPEPTKDGSGRGDPHYRTFDSKKFSFQGNCSYILMKNCGPRKSTAFQVEVIQRGRDGEEVTRVWAVTVRIDRHIIEMGQNNSIIIDKKVTSLDSLPRSLIIADSNVIHIKLIDDVINVEMPSRFNVMWDGDRFVDIHIEPLLYGNVCGLLGNADDDPTNDFKDANGKLLDNVDDFTNSWIVPGR
uniref:IgGFc-binding protein-like n=1 Tax=Saccoglossus kowalevskii TaxID=10224 RepID=A0ABM0MFY7_SACKO|nr:PREDICTED: IgGFc-binding protein-like [Saccoglossus kowalevskii]